MKTMNKLSKYIYFNVVFFFLIFVNIYFSGLIIHLLSMEGSFSRGLVNITYTENTGAAFSLMQDSVGLLIGLSITAVLIIFLYVIKSIQRIQLIELFFIAFMVAGILGNLYERVFFGYVRDFFELTFINFPVFNISDIFINIGVFGIIILILLSKKSAKINN